MKIWTDCRKWEELAHGMWASSPQDDYNETLYLEFMKSNLFYKAMFKVVKEWEFSCLNALTDEGINQVAWLGQAAMAYKFKCPQHVTRMLWGKLSNLERIRANAEAKRAIQFWREKHCKESGKLYKNMEGSLL